MSATSVQGPPTTAAPAATTTSGGNSSGFGIGNGSTQSSLYLFTFLATLLVLLAVSFAIATRSFVLRRRFRQRVESALLRGETFPGMDEYLGRVGGQRPYGGMGTMGRTPKPVKNFGPVPEMWEVELGDGALRRRNASDHKGKRTGSLQEWAGMEPLSLRFAAASTSASTSSPSTSSPAPTPPNPILDLLPPPPTFFPRRWTNFARRLVGRSRLPDRASASPSSDPSPAIVPAKKQLEAEVVSGKEVELSVLIRMPDQWDARKAEDGEVSVVELGWGRVRID